MPDNLKSGVTTACFYDPEINPTYLKLASHYASAVLPARPRRQKRVGRMPEERSATVCRNRLRRSDLRPEYGLTDQVQGLAREHQHQGQYSEYGQY